MPSRAASLRASRSSESAISTVVFIKISSIWVPISPLSPKRAGRVSARALRSRLRRRLLLRRHRWADLADDEAQRARTDMHSRAVGDTAFEDLLRQRVLQFALDDPLQGRS